VTALVLRITGDPQDLCEFVSEELVAVGTVTLRFHTTVTAQGTVVFHATLEGVVDLTGGGQAQLQATAQTVFRPFDAGIPLFDRTRIILTPL
jgi:hypothetical protein